MMTLGENRSRNTMVRARTDRQTDTRTDRQRQTECNQFIICPMLYAIAMGQISTVDLPTNVMINRFNCVHFIVHSVYNEKSDLCLQ